MTLNKKAIDNLKKEIDDLLMSASATLGAVSRDLGGE